MQPKKTIIAFGAHHDDIEIRAGGAVAKYVRLGYEVIYVVMIDSVYVSNRYQGYEKLSNEDILELRASESRKGAEILGASEPVFFQLKPSYYWTAKTETAWRVHFNEGEDELIKNMQKHRGRYFCLEASRSPECIQEVADFIAKHNPEVVLTQQVNDFHPEHYATAALVFAACRKLVTEGMELKLYAWEMGSNGRMIRFIPDVIIDITEEFDIKVEAVKPFHSQRDDRPELHLQYVKASAEYWGAKIGVKYAEPFSEMLIAENTGGFSQQAEGFDYSSHFLGADSIRKQF